MRAPQESMYSGLCHLFNMIPLWGLLYCGWVFYSMREESRYIVRHAREAMIFHSLLMAATLVFLISELLRRLIAVLSPAIGSFLHNMNITIFMTVVAVYWVICLLGAWRCFSRQNFHYPFIGRPRS
ncbi:DUF4870 domain-containing protein [bacterium]|nr:DUF4870 domain-containing protein [bacterium]